MKFFFLTIALLMMFSVFNARAGGDENIDRAYYVRFTGPAIAQEGLLCFYKFVKGPGKKQLVTFYGLTSGGSYSWEFGDYNENIHGLSLEQQDKDSMKHLFVRNYITCNEITAFKVITILSAVDYYKKWAKLPKVVAVPVQRGATVAGGTPNAPGTGSHAQTALTQPTIIK